MNKTAETFRIIGHAIQSFARRSVNKGKLFVVFVFGVVGFGGVMLLLTTFLQYKRNPSEFRDSAAIYRLLLSAVVWGGFGYVQGLLMWRYVQKVKSGEHQR